jgi:hypothetical protein
MFMEFSPRKSLTNIKDLTQDDLGFIYFSLEQTIVESKSPVNRAKARDLMERLRESQMNCDLM